MRGSTNYMQKILHIGCVFFISAALLSAFDYPQPAASAADIAVFFAHPLSETFSSGITFMHSDEVVAADKGMLLMTMNESAAPFFFPSTLGNTVILAHEDNMISVYGNLKKMLLAAETTIVEKKTPLGVSGKSAWQKKSIGLMFLSCDTKNKNSFNPLILLPPFKKNAAPFLQAITLVNSRGTGYPLSLVRTLPAGTYMLYRDNFQGDCAPASAVVLVNGIAADSPVFSVLRQNDTALTLGGNHVFPFSLMYPSEQQQLLAIVTLTRGKTALSVSVSDIVGNTRTISHTLDVR